MNNELNSYMHRFMMEMCFLQHMALSDPTRMEDATAIEVKET